AARAGEPRAPRRREMPFRHVRERTQQTGAGLVERLKRRDAPDAVIDPRATPPERVRQPVAIDAAGPAHVPQAVVFLGPLALEHRLRPAVADLLAPVGAQRVAAVVPDHGGRMEAERPAGLLQPPAHIQLLARGAEL